MNIYRKLRCSGCNHCQRVLIRGHETAPEWDCANCGESNFALVDTGLTIGSRIWEKSYHEQFLREKDYSLAIALAATALDCEIARLYIKWTRARSLRAGICRKSEDIEPELRRLYNVKNKIKKTISLVIEGTLDDLISANPALNTWRSKIRELHKDSMICNLNTYVFWPRNRVLHIGYSRYTKKDAIAAIRISQLSIACLKQLDRNHRLK